MKYGIEIKDSSGATFATPETPFFSLLVRDTIQLRVSNALNDGTEYDTKLPKEYSLAVYVRSAKNQPVMTNMVFKDNSWKIVFFSPEVVTVTFYVFSNKIPPSQGKWGLDFFSSDGKRVFSSSTVPLQNEQVKVSYKDGPRSVDVGHPVAAISTFCDAFFAPYQQIGMMFMFLIGCAHGNTIEMALQRGPIIPGGNSTEATLVMGGVINYINTSLYD